MLLPAVVSFTKINDVFWGQMEQQITTTEGKKNAIFPHVGILPLMKLRKVHKKYMKISQFNYVYYSEHISQ